MHQLLLAHWSKVGFTLFLSYEMFLHYFQSVCFSARMYACQFPRLLNSEEEVEKNTLYEHFDSIK